MKTFKCKVCGYIHTGDKAPDVCPQCQQTGVFEEVKEKKGLNVEGNLYTIVYATIIVVISALLLAVVSSALKPRQEANIALDTQKQILYSVMAQEDVLANANPAALYNEVIEETTTPDGKTYFIAQLPAVEVTEGEVASTGEVVLQTKYIIPMTGNGLWGGIWGYLALDDDKNTIFGAFFNHSGETPGLGADIVTAKFQDRFKGKHILRDGKVAGLGVKKVGQLAEGMEQVDALSGATITCQGVEDMINNTLAEYAAFLAPSNSSIEGESCPAAEVADTLNVEQTKE